MKNGWKADAPQSSREDKTRIKVPKSGLEPERDPDRWNSETFSNLRLLINLRLDLRGDIAGLASAMSEKAVRQGDSRKGFGAAEVKEKLVELGWLDIFNNPDPTETVPGTWLPQLEDKPVSKAIWPKRREDALRVLVARGKDTDQILRMLNGTRFSRCAKLRLVDVESKIRELSQNSQEEFEFDDRKRTMLRGIMRELPPPTFQQASQKLNALLSSDEVMSSPQDVEIEWRRMVQFTRRRSPTHSATKKYTKRGGAEGLVFHAFQRMFNEKKGPVTVREVYNYITNFFGEERIAESRVRSSLNKLTAAGILRKELVQGERQLIQANVLTENWKTIKPTLEAEAEICWNIESDPLLASRQLIIRSPLQALTIHALVILTKKSPTENITASEVCDFMNRELSYGRRYSKQLICTTMDLLEGKGFVTRKRIWGGRGTPTSCRISAELEPSQSDLLIKQTALYWEREKQIALLKRRHEENNHKPDGPTKKPSKIKRIKKTQPGSMRLPSGENFFLIFCAVSEIQGDVETSAKEVINYIEQRTGKRRVGRIYQVFRRMEELGLLVSTIKVRALKSGGLREYKVYNTSGDSGKRVERFKQRAWNYWKKATN